MRKSFFAMSFALMAVVLLADLSLRLSAQPTLSAPSPSVGYDTDGTSNTVRPAISTAISTNNTSPKAQTAAAVSEVTRNWVGYLASNGTYTGISGTWTVPSITAGTGTLSADAAWIGIGGSSSDDLIQVGTENMVEDGQITTNAFYEGLPADSQNISSVSVKPGDTMSASITETSGGEWTLAIEDLTNGQSFTHPVYYNSSESSAEWIEEAPSDQAGIMALDNFGTVSFTDASVITNGQTVGLAASDAEAVGMDNSTGQQLANVSSLNGNSFDVSRTSANNDDSSTVYDYGGFSTNDRRGYQTRPDSTTYPSYRHFRYF